MDDLNSMLSKVLSDPQSMQQIQGILGSLQNQNQQSQQKPDQPSQNEGALDPSMLSALSGILGNMNRQQPPSEPAADNNVLSGLLSGLGGTQNNPLSGLMGGDSTISPQMISMITKIAPLLSRIQQEDDSTRLLRALRPLLSEERQKKMDEAIKILQMMKLLPLLKESGIMSSILPF